MPVQCDRQFNADEDTIMGIGRFDWPACFQAFSNRPDKSPHQNRTYTAAHPTDVETMLTPRTVALTPQPPRSVRTGFKRPLGAKTGKIR
jgi:hypothetical protein